MMGALDGHRIGELKQRLQRAYDDLDVCRTQRDTIEADRDRLEGHNRDLKAIGDHIAAMLRDLIDQEEPATLNSPAAADLVNRWRQVAL